MPPEVTGLLVIIALAYLVRNYLRPALAHALGSQAAAGALATLRQRLDRLAQVAWLLTQPATELPAAADCAKAVEAAPGTGGLLRVALGAATAADWAALAEALPELPADERLRLGFEVTVRGGETILEPAGAGPLSSCERALQAAEVEQAYAVLDQHGEALPLVARLPLQARLAALAEDLELLERTREEAQRTSGAAPPEIVSEGVRAALAPLRERWQPRVNSPWELAAAGSSGSAPVRAALDEAWRFAQTAAASGEARGRVLRPRQNWRDSLFVLCDLGEGALSLGAPGEVLELLLGQVAQEVVDELAPAYPLYETARRLATRLGLGEAVAEPLLRVVERQEPEVWVSLVPRSAPWLLTLPMAEPRWPWLAAEYLQWRWLGRLPRSSWLEPGQAGHRAGCVVLQATLREVAAAGAGPWTWVVGGAPPLDAAVLDAACVTLLDDLTERTSELLAGRYAHGLAQALRLWSMGLGR